MSQKNKKIAAIDPEAYYRPITGSRIELFKSMPEEYSVTGAEIILAAAQVGIDPYIIPSVSSKLKRFGAAGKETSVIPLTPSMDVCLGVFKHAPNLGIYEKGETEARAAINPEHTFRFLCAVTEGPTISSNGMVGLRSVLKQARTIRAARD